MSENVYKVSFYVRVSLEEQAKGYSLGGQVATLKNWAEENEWKWVKTYDDKASGKDTKREKFQEMIGDAKQGLFDGICMLDNDRFSRDTKDMLTVMDNLREHGVKLHIYNLRHIDIYSEQGRFILTNFAAFSEFFRGQLASKIRVGVKRKMENEWFGQAPYGYRVVSEDISGRKKNTRLVENPKEQKVISIMKELKNSGRSYSEIAAILNDRRISTRHKREGKKSKWYPVTVRNILTREVKI